jgi:hypothetical protein
MAWSRVSIADASVIVASIDLPGIELVQRLIVHVRRTRLCDVETIVVGLGRLAKMFLLVSDKMFCTCLNTSTLNAPDGVCEQFTSEIWVWTEALPITATLRRLVARM